MNGRMMYPSVLWYALLAAAAAVTGGDSAVTETTAPPAQPAPAVSAMNASDEEIIGDPNFLTGYQALNEDGTVHVVIECPAGTVTKWAVDPDGVLRRQYADGKPRSYRYIGFPMNYGMIPGTLLAREIGGDGEPLDAMVIGGDPIPRGAVVRTRVIGVLALLDSGEQDDKVVTVIDGPPFENVRDINDLDEQFPGVTDIIEAWFLNCKGQGVFESFGYIGSTAAMRLVNASTLAYERVATEVKKRCEEPPQR